MKFVTAVGVAMLCASPAMAWTNINKGPGPKSISDGSGSAQAQQQGQKQAQGQAQRQSATAGAAASAAAAGGSGGQGGSGGTVGNITAGGSGGGGLALAVPDGLGMAPCGGGISLGGLGLGGGGSGGGSLWEFADCKRIREAHLLQAWGFHQAAVNELCQIDRVLQAFNGKCPTLDQPRLTLKTDDGRPDWCGTVSAGDPGQHPECSTVGRSITGYGAAWPYNPDTGPGM